MPNAFLARENAEAEVGAPGWISRSCRPLFTPLSGTTLARGCTWARNGSVPAGGVSLRATCSAADGTRIAWAKGMLPAVCWWARQIIESTDTSHSIYLAASLLTCNLFTMRG